MSINAYLIKNISLKITENEYIYQKTLEKTPTFSITNNENIFKIFQENNGDNTNADLTGEICIDKESWINTISNLNTTDEETKIIQKISDDFKNKDTLYYHCM